MNDKQFDEILKQKMKQDEHIPEKINQLFSNFEVEVNKKDMNKEKNNILKTKNNLKIISIAASLVLVIFIGGNTYAHINGNETIISPLLRSIGINSNYEKNTTPINESVDEKDVTVKMLDAAIDDLSLIVGYQIDIKNNNPDNWLEIEGEYKINNIEIKPINHTIDKISESSYIYYQIFDMNEVERENEKDIVLFSKIINIREYTECEDENNVYAEYGKTHTGEWKFEENIPVKNVEESKVYEFENSKIYETIKNVNMSVTKYISGSYTNILKIKIDKTNYKGNYFEKYYKILDEHNEEIARFSEEKRDYDENVYNDRLLLSNIDKNSKIKIEVYMKEAVNEKEYKKITTIPVDFSKAVEKVETTENYKEYKGEKYSFKYKDNWNLLGTVDTNRAGPNSIYLGALELEIPSTTNSEYKSSIYIKTIAENYTQEEYLNKIRKENSASPSETFVEESKGNFKFANSNGYQITCSISEGTKYIKKDFFTISNGIVYRITFWGSELEYNNLKSDIDKLVQSFTI